MYLIQKHAKLKQCLLPAMQIVLGTVITVAGAAGGMYGIIQNSRSKQLDISLLHSPDSISYLYDSILETLSPMSCSPCVVTLMSS